MELRTAVEIWCSTGFERILNDLVILSNEEQANLYKHSLAAVAAFDNKSLELAIELSTGARRL
jgi:hypothetical protein